MKKILFFILLTGVLSQACKRKCRDVQSNQAPFRTYTVIPDVERNGKPTDVIAEADTFFVGVQIVIESLVENALKYEWRLQGDPNLKEGKKLAIYFQEPSVRAGDSLEIMSIVTRKPNPECIAGDDGVDTLIKKIYFIDFKNAPWFGKYWVHDEINNPNIFFELKITPTTYNYYENTPFIQFLPSNSKITRFTSFPGCFHFGIEGAAAGNIEYPEFGQDISKGIGEGFLSSDRKFITIYISFFETDKNGDIIKRNIKTKFTGKKIN